MLLNFMGKNVRYSRTEYLVFSKVIFTLALILGSAFLSQKNYLLFHSLAELFSIIVAFTITTIALTTFGTTKENLVLFMGIAYGFIGLFDLLHTLAFPGMGIFHTDSLNLATQLWIIARYMEAVSILSMPYLLARKPKIAYVLSIYTFTSLILLLSVFYWNTFPDCGIYDQGLTPFKLVSEYIISGIFIFALIKLTKNRHLFAEQVYKYLFLAYLTTVVTELSFTLYIDPYGFFNMLGHILKIISFYYIYKAVIKTSIQLPYRELEITLNMLRKEMEHRKAEEELRKNMEQEMLRASKLDSIEVLAGGIAHDFNNLLTIISGQASLNVFYTKDNPKLSEGNNEIIKATQQAISLTQQLLTFSKGNEPIKKTVKINKIISESLDLALSGSNAKSELSFPTDLGLVDIDENQFKQVINNLVINACQAMPKGGIIRVHAKNIYLSKFVHEPFLAEGKYVKIAIEDQGEGISSENLGKIFDPFFTTKEKGHGLGLASCFSIIRKHNGYMSVQSEEGVGSTFYIYLPVSNKELGDITPLEKPALESTHEGRILFMDDELAIRKVVKKMLRELGYKVDFVADGEDAWRRYSESLAKNQAYDVVILDLTIPGGMGGIETAERILNDGTNTKIILSSGYSDESIGKLYNLPEIQFLKKPYTYEELSNTLSSLIPFQT